MMFENMVLIGTFCGNSQREENMQVRYSNPMIHKTFHLLNELSSNDETRLQALA